MRLIKSGIARDDNSLFSVHISKSLVPRCSYQGYKDEMNSFGKYCTHGESREVVLLGLGISGKGHSSHHRGNNVLNHTVHCS